MKVREIMTSEPTVCTADTTVRTAAEIMRDRSIGDVLVTEGDGLCGIVTDRDIVLRAVAGHDDPGGVALREICSGGLHTVEPEAAVADVIRMMEEHTLRRVPVVEGGRPVGIVSLGDLAAERDPNSVLGRISAAAPDR